MFSRFGIVVIVDKPVGTVLIFGDPKFCSRIFVKVIVISVEMIRRNVKQHAYLWMKTINMIQLETADFQQGLTVFGCLIYQVRKGVANISAGHVIAAGFFPGVIEPVGNGGFAVAAGDGHEGALIKPAGDFNLGVHRFASFYVLLYQRSLGWYAGT